MLPSFCKRKKGIKGRKERRTETEMTTSPSDRQKLARKEGSKFSGGFENFLCAKMTVSLCTYVRVVQGWAST